MSDFLLRLPKALYRGAEVKQLDNLAIHQFNKLGFELMQRAGAVVFQLILERWPHNRFLRIYVGSGNNGGDGFIVAELARNQGINCEVILVGDTERLSKDAAEAYGKAKQAGAKFYSLAEFANACPEQPKDLVSVDGLLGIGLDRIVEGEYAKAIELINTSQGPVVAIDIPSGLHSDTGIALGCAVNADITVSFIGLKQGMLTAQGRDFCGEIVFSDLDLPEAVYLSEAAPKSSTRRFDINDATRHFMPRARSSHKGSNGHVVIVGGDTGFGGAVIMAGEAALHSGAGLVSVITRSCNRAPALARCPELMVCGTEDSEIQSPSENKNWKPVEALLDRASALVLGPGLGKNKWSQQLFAMVLKASRANNIPLVIDADALHLLADRQSMLSSPQSMPWVLTPHPGEAGVLLNVSTADVQQDRFAAVRQLATRYGCTCLLKGSGTLIAESDSSGITLCSEGNPGMGSGGMGDVLSGIIGSFLAQGKDCSTSTKVAVAIHGEAADLAACQFGERGLKATDLLDFVRQLVNPTVTQNS
jgi:ADP-dependent NAD(P)H-hydrate dehydratase / NAD(P)H-hydrate epimerase